MDLEEMIHELEVEKQRIQDAVEVLRRLQRIRKPSSVRFDGREESPEATAAREAKTAKFSGSSSAQTS